MSARRPPARDRLFCPGEVQSSGHLWLQEAWHLEWLEPPGCRLHTQQWWVRCRGNFNTRLNYQNGASCFKWLFNASQTSLMPTNLDRSFFFLIINLSLPIEARKNNVLIPVSTSWTSRSKPHVTQEKPNINRLDTLIEISQQRIRRNCKEPGGHFDRFLSSASKIDQVKKLVVCRRSTHRAYKAWVEAAGADNELHRSCGIYSPKGGSRYWALYFAKNNRL